MPTGGENPPTIFQDVDQLGDRQSGGLEAAGAGPAILTRTFDCINSNDNKTISATGAKHVLYDI